MAELSAILVYLRHEGGEHLFAAMPYHEIAAAIPAALPYLEAPRHERVTRCKLGVIRRLYLRAHEIPLSVAMEFQSRDRAIARAAQSRGGRQNVSASGIGQTQGGDTYLETLPSGHTCWSMNHARRVQ